MRHFLSAAAIVAATTSVAFAQAEVTPEAIEAAAAAIGEYELTETFYQNLWCGAAFTIVEAKARDGGATADADQALAIKDALYTAAAEEAVTSGLPEQEFTALSMNFITVVTGQMAGGEEPEFGLEDCAAPAQ